jgi:phenylalanyl-tRNA synthetase beta chain
MRVSLQWLRELVACDTPVAELAERLSIAGFEVEGIEDLAANAAGVVVGLVTDRKPHPNADKLSVCRVEVGGEAPLQIVCGAANVRAGLHVPVALVGTQLPAVNLTIKPAELRGVASTGMICSLQELGLAVSSNGIAVLDELLEQVPPIGTAVASAFGLDDQVLELAITANRPDGLSMQGIAREVAPQTRAPHNHACSPAAITGQPLAVGAADRAAMEAGGLFSLTALRGVVVEPSPAWLQRRLERAGLRPINNVVDITNLVMLETGQPLHAFDSDRLAQLDSTLPAGGDAEPQRIGLRGATAAEPFTWLDGVSHSLGAEALVVTYANQPVALAGVIGGANAAVQPATTNIWLEAAVFEPQAVRRSARSVGLRTDASLRVEKGLPRQVTLAAADRAAALLQELAGARLAGRWLHQRPAAPQPPLQLRRDAVHQLLGPVLVEGEEQDLDDLRILQTLEALGCQLEAADGGWTVTVPPSRAMDLQREVDLIEEVARLVGYDQFACHLPDPIRPGGLEPAQRVERRMRRALCQAGLQELCCLSLVAGESALAPSQRVSLANPLLADTSHLRDSLIEELLQAARRNLQASRPGFWGFEIGTVFHQELESTVPDEHVELAGVICGERRAELWSNGGKPSHPDYFEARGLLQMALSSLAIPCEDRPLTSHGLLHPGRAAELLVEGQGVGWFGQLHPAQAERLDLPEATFLFQLPLAPLLTAATRRSRWQPSFSVFPTVPASERDLALVVPSGTSAAALLATIRKAGKALLESAELIDRYAGDQIAAGTISQAFRLRYRDPRRTLTDTDVEQCHATIRAALDRQFGAQQRS